MKRLLKISAIFGLITPLTINVMACKDNSSTNGDEKYQKILMYKNYCEKLKHKLI